MPLAGAVSKQAIFKRSVSGSISVWSGAATSLRQVAVAAAGILLFTGGIVSRKLIANRLVSGQLHGSGAISKKGIFLRSVGGTLSKWSATVVGYVGAVAVSGILQFTAGIVTRKLIARRSISGSLRGGVGATAWDVKLRHIALAGVMRFRGNIAIAQEFVARGLNKLGQALKMD